MVDVEREIHHPEGATAVFRRYACVRQHDQSDCGAAALATVALQHRRSIGLQKARDLCGTDRVGTNLLGLLEAAERYGFSARAVKGPYEALSEVPLPAIAHVKTEEGLWHFVVLHRVAEEFVVVADSARGVQRLTREEFCERWTGYLLLLVPDETRETFDAKASHTPWQRFLSLRCCTKYDVAKPSSVNSRAHTKASASTGVWGVSEGRQKGNRHGQVHKH